MWRPFGLFLCDHDNRPYLHFIEVVFNLLLLFRFCFFKCLNGTRGRVRRPEEKFFCLLLAICLSDGAVEVNEWDLSNTKFKKSFHRNRGLSVSRGVTIEPDSMALNDWWQFRTILSVACINTAKLRVGWMTEISGPLFLGPSFLDYGHYSFYLIFANSVII